MTGTGVTDRTRCLPRAIELARAAAVDVGGDRSASTSAVHADERAGRHARVRRHAAGLQRLVLGGHARPRPRGKTADRRRGRAAARRRCAARPGVGAVGQARRSPATWARAICCRRRRRPAARAGLRAVRRPGRRAGRLRTGAGPRAGALARRPARHRRPLAGTATAARTRRWPGRRPRTAARAASCSRWPVRCAADFGVCGNDITAADGQVVSVEYGCGAHSEAKVKVPPLAEPGSSSTTTATRSSSPALSRLRCVRPGAAVAALTPSRPGRAASRPAQSTARSRWSCARARSRTATGRRRRRRTAQCPTATTGRG